MARRQAPETFHDAFLAARKQCNLSMAEAGRRVGVTAKSVSRWERGAYLPGYRERARIVAVFANVSPDVLRVLRATLDVPAPADGATNASSALALEATARLAVDSSLLAMAEILPGVTVPTLRAALGAALERLRATNVDVAHAAKVLA